MCAHAVRVALLKMPGVESVDVSLQQANASIRLRPGNTVALSEIREIVKNNGFTAKEAVITVVGSLIEQGGKPALSVTGTNTVMLLAADPKQPNAYTELAARHRTGGTAPVEVVGTVETRPAQRDMLLVRTVRAGAQ